MWGVRAAMSAPDLPLPIFARQGRRQFLRQAAGTGLGLLLAGCSGGGGSTTGAPGGTGSGGSGGGGGATPAADSLPPVSVSGAVDTAEIGGQGLNVLSVFQPQGPVDGGSFRTSVSPNLAQTLIVTDETGAPRALAVNLPTEANPGSPGIGAASTAVALVFMSPGIATSDAALAAQRVAAIQAAPSFPALVAALAARLPSMTLVQALAEDAVRTALLAVLDEIPIEFPTTRFQGRTTEEQNEVNRNGGIFLVRDNESPFTRMQVTINNEGWRFVSLIRQDFAPNGDEVQVVVPQLDGSPTSGALSVAQGINGVSFGSLFTVSTFAPGTATDAVNTEVPEITRMVYWVRGLGNPALASNTPIPSSVHDADFQGIAEGLTVAYYILLPFFEPFLAVGQSLGFTKAADLEDIFGRVALGATGLSVQAALNTTDGGNISLALVDACKELLALGAATLAAYLAGLAGAATASGPVGLVLEAVQAILAVVSATMSAVNFAKAAAYLVQVPRYADVELRIPGPKFLELLDASGLVQVLDVNAEGTVVYSASAVGDFSGGLYYRKLGSPPLRLLTEPGEAVLNSKDDVLFQDTARSGHAVVRRASGELLPITPPPLISRSPTATGIVSLSDELKVVATYDRDNGSGGGMFDLFSYTGSSFDSTGFSTARPGASSVFLYDGLPRRGATSNKVLVTNTRASGTQYQASLSYETRAWTLIPTSSGLFGPTVTTIDVNGSDQVLALRTSATGDPFNAIDFHHEILVNGSVVARFDDHITNDGAGTRGDRYSFTPVALNDAGEVAGNYSHRNYSDEGQTVESFGALLAGGSLVNLETLFPANPPSGQWTVLLMRGRFLVLRLDPDEGGGAQTWLFHRGRTG